MRLLLALAVIAAADDNSTVHSAGDFAAIRHGVSYKTDFSSYDSKNWNYVLGCGHCPKLDESEARDECTLYSKDAGTFGKDGLIMSTTKLKKRASCGAGCQAFHMQFQQVFQYGSYKVRAKWFPESHASTAVGYIGMMQASGSGSASMTFGFRGKYDNLKNDTLGRVMYDGTTTFKTGCYSDSKKSHNLEYINAHARMDEWHVYELEWRSDHVTWTMDGTVMRKITDKSIIPHVPMQLRLHTRSVGCSSMSNDFTAHVSSFEYTPCSSCSTIVVI